MGDWNARLQVRRKGQYDTIGEHVFERGLDNLERRRNDRMVQNRDLLVHLATDNKLLVLNTQFEKDDEHLITYLVLGTTPLASVDVEKFAATGHTLGRKWQRSMFKDVESDTCRAFPSNHFPMMATVRTLTTKNRNKYKTSREVYHRPSKEEKKAFNAHFQLRFGLQQTQIMTDENESNSHEDKAAYL